MAQEAVVCWFVARLRRTQGAEPRDLIYETIADFCDAIFGEVDLVPSGGSCEDLVQILLSDGQMELVEAGRFGQYWTLHEGTTVYRFVCSCGEVWWDTRRHRADTCERCFDEERYDHECREYELYCDNND
ncbi:MAG: hypothetical protein ABIA47_02875 [bacterium]